MAQQLPLDLPHRPAAARQDFFVAPCNAEAVGLVDLWPAWVSPMQFIYGPRASGKSHLLAVWQEKSGALEMSADVIGGDVNVERLLSAKAVIIDNCETLQPDAEEALFHVFNDLKLNNIPCLMAGTLAPAQMKFTLPDLASRLRSLPAITLGAADDTLLTAVMCKLLADRQIDIAPHVMNYVMLRLERNCAAIAQFVARLDAHSLALGKPITRALAADVLAEINETIA